jgi:hypothetical protein
MLFAFDLWSYDDVSKHAAAILARLEQGTMPCDGAWPADQIDAFRRWTAAGTPPRDERRSSSDTPRSRARAPSDPWRRASASNMRRVEAFSDGVFLPWGTMQLRPTQSVVTQPRRA